MLEAHRAMRDEVQDRWVATQDGKVVDILHRRPDRDTLWRLLGAYGDLHLSGRYPRWCFTFGRDEYRVVTRGGLPVGIERSPGAYERSITHLESLHQTLDPAMFARS